MKLNINGTIKGLAKGNTYTGSQIRKALEKYGKVTSYSTGSFGRIYKVGKMPAILVRDTSGRIIEKYPINK